MKLFLISIDPSSLPLLSKKRRILENCTNACIRQIVYLVSWMNAISSSETEKESIEPKEPKNQHRWVKKKNVIWRRTRIVGIHGRHITRNRYIARRFFSIAFRYVHWIQRVQFALKQHIAHNIHNTEKPKERCKEMEKNSRAQINTHIMLLGWHTIKQSSQNVGESTNVLHSKHKSETDQKTEQHCILCSVFSMQIIISTRLVNVCTIDGTAQIKWFSN